MKRILFLALLLSALSCGPVKHIFNIEMRHPSKTGIELAGKNVSVIYLEGADTVATNFIESMADGFAYTLENEYGTGSGSIGIYRMQQKEGANYASKDSLFNLLMDTGSDLVFLFDPVKFGVVNGSSVPFTIKMYCFDGMNQEEKVQSYGGTSIATANTPAELGEQGWSAGVTVADSFKPQWKHEQYTLLYYEEQLWYDALAKAEQYDWKGAMDIWMQQTASYDALRNASAAYNLSLACYMLGDYDLSLAWLDQSDTLNKLPLSDTLRKRILARKH